MSEILHVRRAMVPVSEDQALRKYLKFILLFLFAVFIFWFFGRNLDWQEVSHSLRQGDPW